MSEPDRETTFIKIHRSGVTVHHCVSDEDLCSSSKTNSYTCYLDDHIERLRVGGFIVDTKPAVDKHGSKSAFRAPMVDPDLEGMDIDKTNIPDNSLVAEYFGEKMPVFQEILDEHRKADDIPNIHGSLDYASPMYCATYWARLGANVLRRLPDNYSQMKGRFAFQLESGDAPGPIGEMGDVDIVESESIEGGITS
jgi:hypothetical protein